MLYLIRLNDEKTDLRSTFMNVKTKMLDELIGDFLSNLEPREDIPIAFYYKAGERNLNVNNDLDRIKEEYVILGTKPELSSLSNFSLSSINQENLLASTLLSYARLFSSQIMGKLKEIINQYRKLFCFNYVEKKHISDIDDPNIKGLVDFIKYFIVKLTTTINQMLIKVYIYIYIL